MSRTQGLYITFPQSFQISRKKSALKPLNPSACLSLLRTNERSTVHISHRFYTSLKRLWAVYQSVFVYLRVYDMCVDANVLSMYSGVQLTITVLHQAYRTVSFTLKWPHVVTYRILPRQYGRSNAKGQALFTGACSCALARMCACICAWIRITNKLTKCVPSVHTGDFTLMFMFELCQYSHRGHWPIITGKQRATSSSLLASYILIFNKI